MRITSSPKFRCYEQLSRKILNNLFDFDKKIYERFRAMGMDKSDAHILSYRRIKFKAIKDWNNVFILDGLSRFEKYMSLCSSRDFWLFKEAFEYMLGESKFEIKDLIEAIVRSGIKSINHLSIPFKRMKQLLENPSDLIWILKHFEEYHIVNSLGKLLNSDFYYDLMMKKEIRPILLQKFSSFNISFVFEGLDYFKLDRAFKFIGAFSTTDNFPDLLHKFVFNSYEISPTSKDFDILAWITCTNQYRYYGDDLMTPHQKLREFFFQENPRLMLEVAPEKVLERFVGRFKRSDIEAVREKHFDNDLIIAKLNSLFNLGTLL